jgi:hypothetical protein
LKSLDKRDAEFLREIRNKHLRPSLLERLNRYRTYLFVSECIITVCALVSAVGHTLGGASKESMMLFVFAWALWTFFLLSFAIVDLKIKFIKFVTDEECRKTEQSTGG